MWLFLLYIINVHLLNMPNSNRIEMITYDLTWCHVIHLFSLKMHCRNHVWMLNAANLPIYPCFFTFLRSAFGNEKRIRWANICISNTQQSPDQAVQANLSQCWTNIFWDSFFFSFFLARLPTGNVLKIAMPQMTDTYANVTNDDVFSDSVTGYKAESII